MSARHILGAIFSIYRPRFARTLAYLLQASDYKVWRYVRKFWSTQDFNLVETNTLQDTATFRYVWLVLRLGMLAQLAAGIFVLYWWFQYNTAGGWQFGTALIVSYPIVWAHLLALGVLLWWLIHPKKLGRLVVCKILERQVIKLRAKHNISVVAVAGSVGKTSVKAAVAQLLSATQRVRWQNGNYNDRVTIPLIFFGQAEPSLFNVLAWFSIFYSNARQIKGAYPYDVVVIELGTDGPGQMDKFGYTHPDVAVLTAIAPEHMAQFGSLAAVAREELALLDYSNKVLVNIDNVPTEYLPAKVKTYGLQDSADYHVLARQTHNLKGQDISFALQSKRVHAQVPLLGEQGAKVALAAAAVAAILKLQESEIAQGLAAIEPFPGRMQILDGQQGSTLIDDTYNASPLSAKAALDVLYAASTDQRIAILGSMNELGDYAPEAHQEVGDYCNPSKLAQVVIIGQEAKKYLAPAAKQRGCSVKTFKDPAKAGRYVAGLLKNKAVVLAKGSQNGVFAEEALKPLLANPADTTKLVRQSDYWVAIKQRQFGW